MVNPLFGGYNATNYGGTGAGSNLFSLYSFATDQYHPGNSTFFLGATTARYVPSDLYSSAFSSSFSSLSDRTSLYSDYLSGGYSRAAWPGPPGVERVDEPTFSKAAWELMEIFYADKQSDGWIPECLVDWLSDYGNLIHGEQPTIYSRLVDFQTELVNLQESVAIAARPLVQEIHIWTLDDDSCWLKKFTITNPEIISISGCLETGEFVGKKNKLVLYDTVN